MSMVITVKNIPFNLSLLLDRTKLLIIVWTIDCSIIFDTSDKSETRL